MMQHFALQYVTYENLFGFSLGMIGVAGLVLAFFSLKRKQPPNPYKVSGSFSNACGMGANRLSGSAATSFVSICQQNPIDKRGAALLRGSLLLFTGFQFS